MNLLVAGGAGFIGSHFVRHTLRSHPDCRVAVLDALTYAGRVENLGDVWDDPRFRFYPGRIQDPTTVEGILGTERVTHLVNFAAETHNDRSILDPGSFIQTNTYGVFVLLEAARRFGLERVVHVSTDEVYGSIPSGVFTESSPLEPNTPYSASKAGGDLVARAHHKAFGTPVIVTRGGNNYGPCQYPEKLISLTTVRLLMGKKVPLYGDGSQIREWIHVLDHCEGIDVALRLGRPGEIYNIGDSNERPNREVVAAILRETGRSEDLVKPIPDPRGASHDQRYSMRCDKIRALGWTPRRRFDEELAATVRWYRDHESWWRPIVNDPHYQAFVARFYGPAMGEDL